MRRHRREGRLRRLLRGDEAGGGSRKQNSGKDFHCGKYTADSPPDLLFVRSIIIDVNQRLPAFSATERTIIELLVAHDELFGLQMVELSGGRLKRGTVYVTLGRMQEKGLLESRQEPLPAGAIGLPRRLYRPTAVARRALAAWQAAERIYLATPLPSRS
jgi:PadR family transcriptional regulator, regulatory protein PadR